MTREERMAELLLFKLRALKKQIVNKGNWHLLFESDYNYQKQMLNHKPMHKTVIKYPNTTK